MICRWTYVIILIPFSLCMDAQSTAQWTSWGDAAERRGDHYGASRFYGEALQREPGRMSLQWAYAEACRRSNQYGPAAANYEKVARKDVGRLHPEAMRWLAEMQMCKGDHEAAKKTWENVLRKEKDKESFIAQRARNGIAGCALARELMARPEVVTIEHLPEPLNSYDTEFGARTDSSGALVFTSLRGELNADNEVQDTTSYHAAIYRSDRNGSGWSGPVLLNGTVNSEGDNANATWSSDHRYFYFTRCPGSGPCRLFFLDSRSGLVAPLKGLSDQMTTTQPMVARVNGRETLFFVSDAAGGQGGRDIWRASLEGDRVSAPTPLGPPVNTPGNETCPFYDVEQHKLYFSSDFLPGLGGYDNFMSEDQGGSFSEPQNWMYPLNGPANDLYPTFDMATMSGYFTSNRVGSLAHKGETCCNDIYRFSYPREDSASVAEMTADTLEMPATSGSASEQLTSLREKLPIRLYFHNDEPDPRTWDTITTADYERTYEGYKARVPEYHEARHGDPQAVLAIDAFFRNEVDRGREQLDAFIPLLKEALDEGQRIELVVRGFASPLAKSDYNRNLSLRRIQSMINYLRRIDDGALIPYLAGTAANGARLHIVKAPYGEERSAAGVSDMLDDLKGSVYSVSAALERRIEIEQVVYAGVEGDLELAGAVIDLGPLHPDVERTAEFIVRNTSAHPILLTGAKADCGCTTAQLDNEPIAPGASTTVRVRFNGHAPPGPVDRRVVIFTDGDPSFLELHITGSMGAE
ncbi:MAG: DUF1573 domain-containing protein [Flavobacteriales bacterium]|nr:DUF1573 domain-containing protein [Flavobacteriales bacterium]MCB9166456.1 DUF1573 domain-containing protein [Flavobacteriales bacterium]